MVQCTGPQHCVYSVTLFVTCNILSLLMKFWQKGFWQESRETFEDGIFLRWWWKKCVTNLLHSTRVWDLGLGAIPPIWACRTPGSQYVFWIQIWVQYWPTFTPVCKNVFKSWYKIQMLMYFPKNTRVSVWTLAHSISIPMVALFLSCLHKKQQLLQWHQWQWQPLQTWLPEIPAWERIRESY